MTRISSIVFDKHEQPKRATIITRHGTMKVKWMNVGGDRSWLTSGNVEAKSSRFPLIE